MKNKFIPGYYIFVDERDELQERMPQFIKNKEDMIGEIIGRTDKANNITAFRVTNEVHFSEEIATTNQSYSNKKKKKVR